MQQEASIHTSDISYAVVRPGALVSLLQRGLQYNEVEAHSLEDESFHCVAPFTLLGKHECDTTTSLYEYPEEKREKREEKLSADKPKRTRRISDHAPTPTFIPSTPVHNDEMDIEDPPPAPTLKEFQLAGHVV